MQTHRARLQASLLTIAVILPVYASYLGFACLGVLPADALQVRGSAAGSAGLAGAPATANCRQKPRQQPQHHRWDAGGSLGVKQTCYQAVRQLPKLACEAVTGPACRVRLCCSLSGSGSDSENVHLASNTKPKALCFPGNSLQARVLQPHIPKSSSIKTSNRTHRVHSGRQAAAVKFPCLQASRPSAPSFHLAQHSQSTTTSPILAECHLPAHSSRAHKQAVHGHAVWS